MSFAKLKFKEIIKGKKHNFFINDKSVDESTYNQILNDDSLYELPPLPKPKMNVSPENNCNININNVDNTNINTNTEECPCENCQELLNIISDIREMGDNEALVELGSYIEAVKTKTHMESLIEAYSELGSSMVKVSSRLEIQLENFMEQFSTENE